MRKKIQKIHKKDNVKKNSFAFLVHPRDLNDFFIKFPLLKILPKSIVEFVTKNMPPVVVSRVTGLKSKTGEPIEGHVVAITMTAQQMIEDRDLALKKIKRAAKWLEKRGVGIVGFGALTSSFSKGGLSILDEVDDMGITTGRAYTAKTVTDYAKKCIHEFDFKIDDVRIAVVGAAGSVGSTSAKILAKFGVRNFLFIDIERKKENLKQLHNHLIAKYPGISIHVSQKISDIKNSDIVIAATNSPEVIIKSNDVSPGTIIINDAQPSDVSEEVLDMEDVLVIEGGVINTPGIKCNFNLGLAGREDTFCCLGEVLILAHCGKFENFALGNLDLNLVNKITKMATSIDIGLSQFQNSGSYIDKDKIKNVRNAIIRK
ncbi:hypothetical protein ACFLY0_00800 [Patescibacteria group bacterium]